MAKVKDGIHLVYGMQVQVEDGYVLRVCVNEEKGMWCVPFIPGKYGGWDNAYKQLTLRALRDRMSKDTVTFA